MDKMFLEANSLYQSGERAKALYLYTCCKESSKYLEDDSYRIDVNNAVKQILQRRGRLAGYTMPRPAGSILPDELYQTVQMIRDSNAIPEEKKSVHIRIYLSGAAEMGYAPAQFDMAAGDWLKPQAALEYCEKAAVQGYKKAIEFLPTLKQRVKFEEMELTEGNVQAIFNRCLSTPGEAVTYAQVLQKALAGEDSELFKFSRIKINNNSKTISYLLGQLEGVHKEMIHIPLEYGTVDYKDRKWTTARDILLKLYALAIANDNIRPFALQKDKTLAINISSIKPTLSPKDPSFPAWWEAHKGEWED